MLRERTRATVSGWLTFPVFLALVVIGVINFVQAARSEAVPAALFWIFVAVASIVCQAGHFVVNPNEGRVLQLFGAYSGTVREAGLRWANPFLTKRRISLRVRNFESARLKVNDKEGNPIEIAAVVVWRVVDTAEACFEVDDFESYVKVQSEAAVRALAARYPYDAHEEHHTSLRGSAAEVATELKRELHERLAKAGVAVQDARISHLAYAPEIAASMLQRQQAGAIIAARQRIVEGAVGMVEMALARLADQNVVQLDEERKAAMVSNLLVVLCGERAAQPVVNTGTIYQ